MNAFLILCVYNVADEVGMLKYEIDILGENPHNLVIFLHGYNGTVADHQYAIDWFKKYLHNAFLIVPHAPEISDKNPLKFQWFGMLQHDADNRRALPETSAEEIFAIYDKAGEDIDSCAQMLNYFINEMQQEYDVDDAHTFLCGFSQGAMLTIYTALSRYATLGGAFVFSGLVAGIDMLTDKINSRPQMYLFHGKDDLKVQFKTLPFSADWLAEQKVPVCVKIYPGLAHKMNEEEIRTAAGLINLAAAL